MTMECQVGGGSQDQMSRTGRGRVTTWGRGEKENEKRVGVKREEGRGQAVGVQKGVKDREREED